jgi:hypothetical protein
MPNCTWEGWFGSSASASKDLLIQQENDRERSREATPVKTWKWFDAGLVV